MKTWEHDELAADLADFLRQSSEVMAWTDMQMGPSGSRRPDVFTINKSYSRFIPITYEIKISKSDFNSDVKSGKWQEYLKFSAGVYFAVPAGLVTKADIPAQAGLIVRNEDGWRRIRTPTLNKVETLPHHVWMKLLIDGIDREATRQKYQLECKHTQANTWLLTRKFNQKYGEHLGQLIARGMSNHEALQGIVQEQEDKLQTFRLETQEKLRVERERYESERLTMLECLNQIREQLGLNKYHSPVALQYGQALTVDGIMKQIQSKISEEHQLAELRDDLTRVQQRLADAISRLPETSR